MQELLDNRHRFRREVRILLELIRNGEHVHAHLCAIAPICMSSEITANMTVCAIL